MYQVTITSNSTAATGGPWINLWYFQGSGFQADAQAAADAVRDFYTSIQAQLHTSVTWSTGTVVKEVTDAGVLTNAYAITQRSGAGLQAANTLLPVATQLFVNWGTGAFTAGRELRGRTRICGYTEAANLQGVPDPVVVAGVQTAADTLKNVAAPNPMVIWSRKNANHADVTTAQVRGVWGVLRSRKDI